MQLSVQSGDSPQWLITILFYSILARAVSRLETNNAQVRQELYEYARAILNAHFDRSDPQISTLGVIDERVEFETAILRVEAESQSRPERSPERLQITFRCVMTYRILLLYCVSLSCQRQAPIMSGSLRPLHT